MYPLPRVGIRNKFLGEEDKDADPDEESELDDNSESLWKNMLRVTAVVEGGGSLPTKGDGGIKLILFITGAGGSGERALFSGNRFSLLLGSKRMILPVVCGREDVAGEVGCLGESGRLGLVEGRKRIKSGLSEVVVEILELTTGDLLYSGMERLLLMLLTEPLRDLCLLLGLFFFGVTVVPSPRELMLELAFAS